MMSCIISRYLLITLNQNHREWHVLVFCYHGSGIHVNRIHVDARPIVQRVYQNIINVHTSQILHWSLENLPKTQAGCRLQIHSASSCTISNNFGVHMWTTSPFQKNETVITNLSHHHPRHFVPSAFADTSMMLISVNECWLFLYFISTYGNDVKPSNSVS